MPMMNICRRKKALTITFLCLSLAATLSLILSNKDTRLFNFIRDSKPNSYTHESSMNRMNYQWLLSRSGVSGRVDLGVPAEDHPSDKPLGLPSSRDRERSDGPNGGGQ